jgi:hypothetical protein
MYKEQYLESRALVYSYTRTKDKISLWVYIIGLHSVLLIKESNATNVQDFQDVVSALLTSHHQTFLYQEPSIEITVYVVLRTHYFRI